MKKPGLDTSERELSNICEDAVLTVLALEPKLPTAILGERAVAEMPDDALQELGHRGRPGKKRAAKTKE